MSLLFKFQYEKLHETKILHDFEINLQIIMIIIITIIKSLLMEPIHFVYIIFYIMILLLSSIMNINDIWNIKVESGIKFITLPVAV